MSHQLDSIFSDPQGHHGPMTCDDYNTFCASLRATTHAVQWGDADVWKVGGKVFAICAWHDRDGERFTFKVSKTTFDLLKDRPGFRPAPYLASRDMTWIQHHTEPRLSNDELKDCLRKSHCIVSLSLGKKRQKELGLNQPDLVF